MRMKPKIIKAHMEVAGTYAKLSTARRLQVGAIVVKDDRIISIGYNGMPSGWDNNCEDKDWDTGAGGWLDPDEFEAKYPFEAWHEGAQRNVRYGLKTKPEVLHAEANAIAKVARSPESAEDSVIFITHAPCIECAKLIYQSGIRQVFYRDNYRSEAGTDFLKQAGVTVNKLDEE
ncbi:ComEB Deoxycytidylate deaminase [uncultured Caudovirales phage]|uniref:ComEB Deoxycytidylate deaminase n=1 Tax=uncultured Caudovirales phage TaxID=2100421 RepID=A0A6J5TBN7_9CAUD|nr:ComEB Deoxycytidylate deaminase [uncultured Caudovirales phage]